MVIDVSGATPTVTIDSSTQASVNSIQCSDPLAIAGGSLAVAANSTISDGLTMTLGASLTAVGSGVTLSVSGTTSVSDSSLLAQAGATLTLPQLTTYAIPDSSYESSLEATGTGSVLNLQGVTSFGTLESPLYIEAETGGEVLLPSVTAIDTTQTQQQVAVEADGAGSEIDLSAVTSFTSTSASGSELSVTDGATVLDGSLTSLSGVTVLLDGTGTLAINQWSSFTSGTLTITGGTYSFGGLTDVDNSSFLAESGGSLTLPEATSYANPLAETTFESTGSGSVLSLPVLASLAQLTSYLEIDAYQGGQTDLPDVAAIDNMTQAVSDLAVNADASGSAIDLSALTSIEVGVGSLTATNGAEVSYDKLASITGVQVSLDGAGASLALPSLASADGCSFAVGSGSTLTLSPVADFVNSGATATISDTGAIDIGTTVVSFATPGNGLTITLPQTPNGLTVILMSTGTFGGGTTVNVPAGDTIAFASETFTGGVVYNVAAGATVDLTGGQAATYGGTLSGSGGGTVQLTSGTLDIGVGGLTMDFPGSMFQWTGGLIDSALGDLSNAPTGTINLTGTSDDTFADDGTFDDFGTIIQTGSGNLDLHSDNVTATTLDIEAGGSYLIEADSGVNNHFGGQTAVVNAGTIEKAGGTGTSEIVANGTLTNTGTIEADSGTLSLSATIAEVSGSSLTAGTWSAEAGRDAGVSC